MRGFRTRSSVGRVSVSEAEGRWFDPSRVRHIRSKGRLKTCFQTAFSCPRGRAGILCLPAARVCVILCALYFFKHFALQSDLEARQLSPVIRSRTLNRRSEIRHYPCIAKPGFVIGLQAE